MIAPNLLLKRRKDGLRVITLKTERPNGWAAVRYVASGRKGYLKHDVLENDYVVCGQADATQRWDLTKPSDTVEAAAALEDLRERDVQATMRRLLKHEFAPYTLSTNARVALEGAVHMILAGV